MMKATLVSMSSERLMVLFLSGLRWVLTQKAYFHPFRSACNPLTGCSLCSSEGGVPSTASGHAQTASGGTKTASGRASTASGRPKTVSGRAPTASGPASTASGCPQKVSGKRKSLSVRRNETFCSIPNPFWQKPSPTQTNPRQQAKTPNPSGNTPKPFFISLRSKESRDISTAIRPNEKRWQANTSRGRAMRWDGGWKHTSGDRSGDLPLAVFGS